MFKEFVLMTTKATKIRSKVQFNCKKYDDKQVNLRTHNRHYAEERLQLKKSKIKNSDKEKKTALNQRFQVHLTRISTIYF